MWLSICAKKASQDTVRRCSEQPAYTNLPLVGMLAITLTQKNFGHAWSHASVCHPPLLWMVKRLVLVLSIITTNGLFPSNHWFYSRAGLISLTLLILIKNIFNWMWLVKYWPKFLMPEFIYYSILQVITPCTEIVIWLCEYIHTYALVYYLYS